MAIYKSPLHKVVTLLVIMGLLWFFWINVLQQEVPVDEIRERASEVLARTGNATIPQSNISQKDFQNLLLRVEILEKELQLLKK
ncbi:hypothetical protein [Pseudodesulfovibrio pelocollis]|uniref:hypothetical protein n=1 Tax=Pseudodesulfovibrio pelocollis TaxID=3051432 RepID=UPI00255A8785|nr:hypothetical protein [Pseudodesulfovibrio sp. SB368]